MKVCRKCRQLFEDASARYCPADGTTLSEVHEESPHAPDTLAGQVIDGRFRIISKLGAGGMGTVYLAHQESVERKVAIKVMSGTADQASIQRFFREARSTSALRSVHTVVVHDFGKTSAGQLYLAMELLEGTGLDCLLSRQRALPWPRALHIAAQVAESLAEAHDKGLVHRDLKPSNVFLVPMGDDPDFVKVLDFGIAKVASEGLTTEITQKGSVLGTPTYMSPEQARSDDIDGRSDLYALGVLLYQLISGRPPFAGDTPLATILKHVEDDVPPFDVPGAPPPVAQEIRELVLSLLEKDPDRRVQSARLARRRLLAILGTHGPAAHHPATPAPDALLPTVDMEAAVAPKRVETPPPASEGTLTDELSGRLGRSRTRRGLFGALLAAVVVATATTVALMPGSTEPGQPAAPPATSEDATSSVPADAAVVAVAEDDAGTTIAQADDAGAAVVDAATAPPDSGARAPEVRSEAAPKRFVLDSKPSGARIKGLTQDGEALPRTPITLDVPADSLELTLSKKDYISRTITIDENLTDDLVVPLTLDTPLP